VEAVVALSQATAVERASVTFEACFPGLFRDAYRIAFRLLGNRSEAEDVAAESCARAYSRWSTVSEYAEPWCVRVAGNLALDLLRARSRAAARQRLISDAESSPGDGGLSDMRIDLYRALESLPRRQRQAVLLRYLGDLSEQQTAEALRVSVGSVKTHASRGLARLREVMQS
jgi:RNA polymerase sigma factor (sigma-70 family)